MGFVPQPVLAAVVAALATVASLSCADSHKPSDPAFAPNAKPPSSRQTGEPVQDVVNKPERGLKSPGVAQRMTVELKLRNLESEVREGT